DLTVQVGCAGGANGKPAVMVVPTWSGPPEEGEARVAPFLKLGTLLAGAVQAMSCGTSLTLFDPYLANGQPVFMETCWLPALDRGAIDVFIQAMHTAARPVVPFSPTSSKALHRGCPSRQRPSGFAATMC